MENFLAQVPGDHRAFLVPWLVYEPIGPERLRDLAEGRHPAATVSSGLR